MRSPIASATSRCCAPSCRLRSSRRRSASPATTTRAREAASCSCASALASAIATSSGERRDSVLVAWGERMRRLARDDHRTPQRPVEHDRRADPGPYPELLQPLGEPARQPRIVIHPLRLPTPTDLRRQRLPIQLDPRTHGHARNPRLIPPADHIRRPVVAVPNHVRRLRAEQPADLRCHRREHASGITCTRNERRDPPQRRLLVEQGLHRRAVGGVHRDADPLTSSLPRQDRGCAMSRDTG